jgi:hypothetical protein
MSINRRLFNLLLALVVVLTAAPGAACTGRLRDIGRAAAVPPTALPLPNSATPAIPAEYDGVYANLKSALDRFDIWLDGQGTQQNTPVFGAELLPANCNRGEELLQPGVLEGVKLFLDRFGALGVQGVTIPIHYPVYTPQFPRFTEYVSFYQSVAREVRRRGMKLDIESHVLFANTTFSPVKWDYSRLTFDQYKVIRREMITRVINDLHPDFLNIGAEPDTEAALTGMKDLLDPQKYTDYIAYLLDGLPRGDTKVVAGIGSWGKFEYARKLADLPSLDGLSLHIYPVIGDCLTRAVQIAGLARASKKFVVLDECWLSKTDVLAASGVASAPGTFKRDAYSFWAPLDEEFLAVMVKFSRLYGVAYLSPFWTGFFFAYLDYTPGLGGLSYAATAAAAAPAQSLNARNGSFTSTALKYRGLTGLNAPVSLPAAGFGPEVAG